jgi:DnaJ-class molecular chaperone
LNSKCFDCLKTCKTCNGNGNIQIQQKIGFTISLYSIHCDNCKGIGNENTGCDKCTNGNILKELRLYYNVPKENYNLQGIGYFIKFPGVGEPQKKKECKPGDFILQINFKE